MKNKLRKITINNLEYLYCISDKYHSETETNTLTIKIFLSDHRQKPLIIDFLTCDHYYAGQLLNSGINLVNKTDNTEDFVNLNHPKYIRKLIELGRKNGWTGTNKFERQNGLNYLNELGYETDILLPINKRNIP